MTWVAASNHVSDVVPLGAPYIGVRAWGVSWASWVRSSTRSVWSRTGSSSRAISGVVERRRNPAEIRQWAGRQKRRRRTVLAGWDRAARLRAQQRGRERAQ